MTGHSTLDELIAITRKHHPELELAFLADTIYSRSLTKQEEQDFVQFLRLTREQQNQDSLFESTFHHLLHLYVLNGSRLHLLQLVDRRVRGLAQGQAGVLEISGVSGIGKTSLVLAFQERMQLLGLEFISVLCSEKGDNAYGLWQEVVRSIAVRGIAPADVPAPISHQQEFRSAQHLRQSLADWLGRCASQRPLVLLLDDLHWADGDSLEVLNYLTSQSARPPILFVVTYRSDETQKRPELLSALSNLRRSPQLDSIPVKPLNIDDIERLVTAYLGPCSSELRDYLFKRAEGHPLFTMELLHDLVAQNSLTLDRGGFWLPPEQSVPVPMVLRELLTQRIRRLGSDVERLLAVAAVAGESWDVKLIEPLLDLDQENLLRALENALKADLITGEDEKTETYRFSHGLIREVLYAGQLSRRRKQVHEQIALQIEKQQENNILALAHHFYEAEIWEKAIHYSLAAGQQSTQRFAFYSALEWYQKALTAAEQAGKAISTESSLRIYDRLGRTHRVLEQRDAAERIYTRMRDTAQRVGDQSAEGNALINLAYIRINQYQFDLAERTAREALKIGERTGDRRMLASVHTCLGVLMAYRDNLTESRHNLNEAHSHAQFLEDPVLQSEIAKHSSYLAIWQGQYREAERYSQITFSSAQRSTDPLVQAAGYQNLAWSQIESGKYPEAYQNLLSVIDAGEASNTHYHNLPRLLNLMGYLHLELGDAQRALAWDQKALAASWNLHSQGNYEMRRYSLLNIATDYLQLGKFKETRDVIEQFESIRDAPDSVRFRYFNRYQLVMSELYLRQRMFDQSTKLAREARSLALSNGVIKNVAKSHWFEGQALAGIMQLNQAIEHLEKGIEIAEEIQHGSLRWKIRLSLAETLRKAGKSPTEVMRRARELIDRTIQSLAGTPLQAIFLASGWVEQVEGTEQITAPDKPLYPAGLTQREVEVLQLVARGATNQQVAEALHISVRTVNTHMTSILTKTGCENRTAASAFAMEHNLVPR